ncbi:potassium channel family protein [Anaerotalea alkaliphila]|uniref:Trk system potassium uptake protein TrkA n=1 Tax=Anaerotalea alkaliphila TaxID=2662126 RepID=A0A7X5KLS2_9FIRM|nr:potassium channel protein [Anaerotalea alkaliphila]NDL66994.1 potassium channel protein [Anaerotalea alkaliphila]
MEDNKKMTLLLGAFLVLNLVGILGYMHLLDVGFVDAFYMTVNTISTVGFSEVGEMTVAAKLFSVFLIFTGLGVVGYGVTGMVSLFFEGNMKDAWRRKRMEAKIKELKDHYIICGAGEIGQIVIRQMEKSGTDFVVIETDDKQVAELRRDGVLTIRGDATHEDVLEEAGIQKAKGIVSSLSSDADNVFAVLTARQMNQGIYIVSRAIEKNSHEKLRKAGADKTVSPNEIGGRRMAASILRPSLISFLDVITQAGDVTLDLEEVLIRKGSALAGVRLREARIPERTGLVVLAIKGAGSSRMRFNPNSDEVLGEGDTMIVMGTEKQVLQLKEMAS